MKSKKVVLIALILVVIAAAIFLYIKPDKEKGMLVDHFGYVYVDELNNEMYLFHFEEGSGDVLVGRYMNYYVMDHLNNFELVMNEGEFAAELEQGKLTSSIIAHIFGDDFFGKVEPEKIVVQKSETEQAVPPETTYTLEKITEEDWKNKINEFEKMAEEESLSAEVESETQEKIDEAINIEKEMDGVMEEISEKISQITNISYLIDMNHQAIEETIMMYEKEWKESGEDIRFDSNGNCEEDVTVHCEIIELYEIADKDKEEVEQNIVSSQEQVEHLKGLDHTLQSIINEIREEIPFERSVIEVELVEESLQNAVKEYEGITNDIHSNVMNFENQYVK